MKRITIHNAFTLIELLIVIAIAGILASITLNMNRSRIADMKAMNEREQRISAHNQLNRDLTSTNYIGDQKISTIEITYSNDGITWSFTIGEWEDSIIQTDLAFHTFRHHNLSGNLFFSKTPLTLGCTADSTKDNKIWLTTTASHTSYCFQLHPQLCNRKSCN